MAKHQATFYFDCFIKLVDYSIEASEQLGKTIQEFNPEAIMKEMSDMHAIEHAADLERHTILQQLIREFITPIEPEDIMLLIDKIDDVTDSLDDVVRKFYMYNIKSMRPEARTMACIIIDCCHMVKKALLEFHDFRKSTALRECIVQINELEEQGDRVHRDALHRLYCEGDNAVDVLAWTTIFECMEQCCDVCEDVSDLMELIIMKNT